ncbi:MAG: glycine cleavage system protein GcvH [Candidatus Diapherotrites archaeon]|nr:glycine cleavage system protein GcvH [Candidatus Diapherotrites archaeon]
MASPADRKYSKDHEWCKLEGGIATVGITDYAQHSLTDLVFVELPKLGAKVEQNKPMCSVESVKSVSDVFAPVSGTVAEVNSVAEKNPELLNKDPYGTWIAKIKIGNEKELGNLLDSRQYDAFVEEEKKKK